MVFVFDFRIPASHKKLKGISNPKYVQITTKKHTIYEKVRQHDSSKRL
jgi:hypothetical protein